ncbi:MAG: hypothetical protein ACYCZR_08910, partial [Burkholderiales bacterium]
LLSTKTQSKVIQQFVSETITLPNGRVMLFSQKSLPIIVGLASPTTAIPCPASQLQRPIRVFRADNDG